jgi:hypothetical protein
MNGNAFETAAKAGKKTRKRKRCKKQEEQCHGQAEQCRGVFTLNCEGNAICEEATFACCDHMARCAVADALACLHALG